MAKKPPAYIPPPIEDDPEAEIKRQIMYYGKLLPLPANSVHVCVTIPVVSLPGAEVELFDTVTGQQMFLSGPVKERYALQFEAIEENAKIVKRATPELVLRRFDD